MVDSPQPPAGAAAPAASADTAPPATAAQAVVGSWGLFTAVLLVMLGNGMMLPLLGIRAELEGFSTAATGIMMGAYYTGFLAGAMLTRRMVSLVGHIRVYAALASLASTGTLVYIVSSDPIVWSAVRLLTGFAMSGLFIIAESWLGDASTNQNRGRILAAYMVVLMGGMGLGQLLLTLADPAGIVLFIVGSILVSIAVIPITLSTAPGPRLAVSSGRLPVRRVWKAAPLGVAAALGQGIGVSALLSLGAVFGARVGMSVDRIALFTSAAIFGSIALQAPVGMLSDRVGRRKVILGAGLLAAGACLVMVNIDHLSWWAVALSFLTGGLALSLYPLALSYINDRVPPGSAAGVSSLMSFTTGIGSILGPLGGALAMEVLGREGLFWFVGGVYGGISLYTVVRILTQEGVPASERRAFVLVPARAGAAALHLARRLRHPSTRRPARDGGADPPPRHGAPVDPPHSGPPPA